MGNKKVSEKNRPYTASATAKRFSSTIKWAAVGEDKRRSAHLLRRLHQPNPIRLQ